MFSILSENSRSVKRLIAAQFCMAIFSVMVIFSTAQWETINLLVSIFCVCFYMFFVYTFMWEAGTRAAARKEKPDKQTGFKIAVLIAVTANLFNLLCAVVYTVCKVIYTASPDPRGLALQIGDLTWFVIKYAQAMYLGIEVAIFPTQEGVYLLANPLYFYLIIIPPAVTGICAYMLGLSGFSFLEKMGFDIKREYKAEHNYKSSWK